MRLLGAVFFHTMAGAVAPDCMCETGRHTVLVAIHVKARLAGACDIKTQNAHDAPQSTVGWIKLISV